MIIAGFLGENRALEHTLLPDQVGTLSRNQKPGRGDLRPWNEPLPVVSGLQPGVKTIYRMGREVASDTQYWLQWGSVVHAIHGFTSGDTTERTFYTGDGAPKQTNTLLALASAPFPTAYRDLGVPRPASALIVSTDGSGVSTETEIRYYVYTYVTDWGDESAPSPLSVELTLKTDDVVDISNIDPPPAGAHGINRVRVYRAQTGTSGDAEFFFLRELPSSATDTEDDNRPLGEVLPTDGWLPPPATLTHLTAMWNGMAAAIDSLDGSVRYPIAYKPYAWPVAYETLAPNARAVALATFGQRLLILTNGRPVLVTGSSPDSLDEQPLEIAQACIAPRSAVGFGHGVVWACPDGLAYFGDAGAKLLTNGLMTREDWRAINPASIVAASYEGAYIAFYDRPGGGRGGFLIDPLAPQGFFPLDQGYDGLFLDESRDALFVLDGTEIKKWDAGPAPMTARFRSKVFAGTPRGYAGGRVAASSWPVQVSVDARDLPAPAVAALVAKRPTIYSAPNATTLRYTSSVTGPEPFPVPGDIVAREWQVSVDTVNPVQSVALAASVGELGG